MNSDLFKLLKLVDNNKNKLAVINDCTAEQLQELLRDYWNLPWKEKDGSRISNLRVIIEILASNNFPLTDLKSLLLDLLFQPEKLGVHKYRTLLETMKSRLVDDMAFKDQVLDKYLLLATTKTFYASTTFNFIEYLELLKTPEIARLYLPRLYHLLPTSDNLEDAISFHYELCQILISLKILPEEEPFLTKAFKQTLKKFSTTTLVEYYRSHSHWMKNQQPEAYHHWPLIHEETKTRGHIRRKSEGGLIRKMSIHAGKKLTLAEAQALSAQLKKKDFKSKAKSLKNKQKIP